MSVWANIGYQLCHGCFVTLRIAWYLLLHASVRLILRKYGITKRQLVIDDSDHSRSKTTKRLFKTYKQKDKGTGGYVNGRTIVLLLLVTSSITVHVGFVFYMQDPKQSAWHKVHPAFDKTGSC